MTTSELTPRAAIKYQEIAEGLRQQIRKGLLKPGDRLPSLAEMYETQGLSRSTVERVHRLLESDGLVVREPGRGTFVTWPSKRAKGLIGLSGYGFEEASWIRYWAKLTEGLQQSAALEEQGVVSLNSKTFSGWDRVDGVVMADRLDILAEQVALLPPDMPRVSIMTETAAHDCVVPNEHMGGQLATEHLLALGHRRIACLVSRDIYPTNRRYAGYREALKAAGVVFDERWARDYSVDVWEGPDFTGRGHALMREWLNEDWHELGCTAIILQNDMVGVGVLKALQEAGVSVPGQVSVVGFDNTEICDYVSPRLTSVAVPLQAIAMTAVTLLRRQMESGRGIPTVMALAVRLVMRDSTAPPQP